MEIKKVREDLRKGKTIYDMNLKVAYYGRVSTDEDDQLNSLENQQHYFEDMIKENLPYLVNLLVDKVIVEKVNEDRKHIKLFIYFDFNTPDIDIDLDMNTKNELKSRSLQTLACRR